MAEREQLPVDQARMGSPDAWNILFRRYQLPLYAYVFEMVHDEQASLDIVQETFINASRHLDGLLENEKFGGWLFGIAHQKCIQHWRKQGREERGFEEVAESLPDIEEGPDDGLIRQEMEAELMDRLKQLPPPQRSVVLLHYLEDMSLEEIATITGARLGTVKSRLHYAKRALRQLFQQSP